MHVPFTTLRGALLGLLLIGLHACTHHAEELPIPALSGPALSAEDVRLWYQGTITAPSAGERLAAGASAQTTIRPSNPAQQSPRWNRTHIVGQGASQLLLVPLANDAALFAHSTHAGTRYLVVTRTPAGTFEGNILELLLRRTAAPVDTTALFAALYRNYQSGLSSLVSGDGIVLLYSADYQYLTGHRFKDGHFLVGSARLAFQRHADGSTGANAANRGTAANGSVVANGETTTNFTEMPDATCIDWYDGNTGAYLTSTGDCGDGGGTGNGGYEPPYTGLGTTGPGGYDPNPNSGGGGSNSSGGNNATSVQLLISSGPKIDPRQETKCFDKNQGAIVTVYVQQAVPNTSNLNGGAFGVGHTFIGIEQNGITRYIDYYPLTGANQFMVGLGVNYPGELRDNSGETYHVSVTTRVSSIQLGAIIDYTNNVPSTYNLNIYNCADFGIAVGNLAGMNLPSTTTSAMFGRFNGRSPGQLGQDIRSITLPAGSSVNTNGGNAPIKQGTCP